jgi:DNA modification methylase
MNKPIQVQQTPVDALIPFARNARTHSDEQVKQIAASIREFGFNNPILIRDDLTVIAGHGRLAAAKVLGLKEVPTISLAHLTPLQVRAYVLADNKLALNAGWDDEMLALELQELALEGFDAALAGFDDVEIGALLADKTEEGLTDEDAVPEAPKEPTTKMGDVWLLGNHRVMCGDSTSVDAMNKLMDGTKADMVFTDPPYGMSYSGGRGKHETWKGGNKRPAVLNDGLEGAGLLTLLRDSLTCAKVCSKSGSAAYVCFPWRTYAEFQESVIGAGFEINACIVWDKKSIGLGQSHFRPQHEFIFYSQGDSWFGGKGESDVWYMTRGNTGAYVHPTQKPIELVERAITNSSKNGDVVIDCFGGSGSTLIACEKTGRANRSMELEPKYCDVIVKRWQDFTGKKAVLESNGKTFDELKAK